MSMKSNTVIRMSGERSVFSQIVSMLYNVGQGQGHTPVYMRMTMIMSMKSNTVMRISGDINQSSHRHTVKMAFCFESGPAPGPVESPAAPLPPAAAPD